MERRGLEGAHRTTASGWTEGSAVQIPPLPLKFFSIYFSDRSDSLSWKRKICDRKRSREQVRKDGEEEDGINGFNNF